MKNVKFRKPIIQLFSMLTLSAFVLVSCDSGDEDAMATSPDDKQGTAKVAVTDAAIGAENVTGFYLQVEGIKFDGVEDDNDTTVMFKATQEFNLMAYQNGDVFDLADVNLNAGSYSDISLVLSENNGAVVTYNDGSSAEVEIEGDVENEYEIVGNFDIEANMATQIVADIDLRKAFNETSQEGKFMLRSTARLLDARLTGTIEGSIENYQELEGEMDSSQTEAQVIVYAYLKGEFDESEREDPDGNGLQTRFENSVNSAVVAEDGSFTLAFMGEGDYEIVVASFEKSEMEEDEEPFEFSSLFELSLFSQTDLALMLGGIDVKAESETEVKMNLNW